MSQPKRRNPRPQAKSPTARKPTTNSPITKLDALEAALRAPKGASISDLMRVTGWQMHSVRGALAGALKKRRGLTITSTKVGSERIYKLGGKK